MFIVVFAAGLQSKPIKANFDASIEGKCLNTGFYIGEFINMFLDLALVVMPIPIIWKLKLPRRERLALRGIFLTSAL
jgi:hypothetical protein